MIINGSAHNCLCARHVKTYTACVGRSAMSVFPCGRTSGKRFTRGSVAARSIVEEGKRAYGTHIIKEGETPVREELLKLFLKVQNGSDVRGVALDGVEGEAVNLSLLTVFFIARGFATWLSRKLELPTQSLRVAVGRDSRISGLAMRCAFEAGLASKGASIADCGLATTPAMFFSCIATGYMYDGGVMITASHLPFNRNGMKFFTRHGGLEKMDIRWILEEAATDCGRQGYMPGQPAHDPARVIEAARMVQPSSVVKSSFMDAYCASLRTFIKEGVQHPENYDMPLAGMHILVDAGNGAGGFFTSQVLEPLGADTAGSQFLDPDGNFPNHVPNPENAEAMRSTSEAVLKNGADLGVVFDTDVDRSGIVDAEGKPINKNKLIALMAAITLRQHPGSTIVTDSVTSEGLTKFIEKLGGKHFRYMRGYKNVINKGIELNEAGEECHLMMETSGHGAMKENKFLDDGAYMAVKVIIEAARRRWEGRSDVSQLLSDLKEPAEDCEIRMKIGAEDWSSTAEEVIGAFEAWVQEDMAGRWQIASPNYEGVRVQVMNSEGEQTGWALLRSSLHDPLIVLNLESEADGGLKDILDGLKTFLDGATLKSGGKVKDTLDMAAFEEKL